MKKVVLTLVLLVLFLGAFAGGRHLFFKKNEVRPDLTVIGFINMADGLGRHSAELFNAVRKEIQATFIPTRGRNKNSLSEVPGDTLKAMLKKSKKKGKVVFFFECLWFPSHHVLHTLGGCEANDQIRIAYSMFESTKIPPEWVVILNSYFDAVAVPEKFLVDAYRDSGVEIPIFELPLAVDLTKFLSQPLKTKRNTPMVFANFGYCTDRKNQLMLIKGFAKAFGNDKNVVLKINSREGDPKLMEAIREEIKDNQLDNVQFTNLDLEADLYLKIFKSIDCYVNISKGEGFSIQPREAMAMGVPVIVSDNTGQSTICDSGLVRKVDSKVLEPAKYPWGQTCGMNFNCKEDDVAAALRDVHDNYEAYLKNNQKAHEWVKQYLYENLQPLFMSMIKPKKLILGERNEVTKEYLMTSSEVLYEKYITIVNPSLKL